MAELITGAVRTSRGSAVRDEDSVRGNATSLAAGLRTGLSAVNPGTVSRTVRLAAVCVAAVRVAARPAAARLAAASPCAVRPAAATPAATSRSVGFQRSPVATTTETPSRVTEVCRLGTVGDAKVVKVLGAWTLMPTLICGQQGLAEPRWGAPFVLVQGLDLLDNVGESSAKRPSVGSNPRGAKDRLALVMNGRCDRGRAAASGQALCSDPARNDRFFLRVTARWPGRSNLRRLAGDVGRMAARPYLFRVDFVAALLGHLASLPPKSSARPVPAGSSVLTQRNSTVALRQTTCHDF